MSDKMREAFEKWALSNEGPSVSVMRNEVGRYEDEELNMAWLGWQAAQSVPVMGEAVAWAWNYSGMIVTTDKAKADAIATLADSGEFRQHNVKVRCLYEKPTTSITQAELDAKEARIRGLETAALDVCMAQATQYSVRRCICCWTVSILSRQRTQHVTLQLLCRKPMQSLMRCGRMRSGIGGCGMMPLSKAMTAFLMLAGCLLDTKGIRLMSPSMQPSHRARGSDESTRSSQS